MGSKGMASRMMMVMVIDGDGDGGHADDGIDGAFTVCQALCCALYMG